MGDAPEKLWMTAEEQGWPGSFRSFRLSDLEHPEEYPAYVRADLYEQVKRERDFAEKQAKVRAMDNEGLRERLRAAERLAGARVVVPADELRRYIEKCKEISNSGEYSWWSRLAEILAALAEPAGEVGPVRQQVGWAYRDKRWDEDRWHVCGWEKPRECEGREVQPIFVGATPPASAIREAMEPFRRLADEVFRIEDGREMNAGKSDDSNIWGFDRAMITYGDLRRLRAALAGSAE